MKNANTIQKKKRLFRASLCRRRDLNPHERFAHYDLNVARLPIPPLRQTSNQLLRKHSIMALTCQIFVVRNGVYFTLGAENVPGTLQQMTV